MGLVPRDYQWRAVKAVLSGNDVFVIAETGLGKSLVFQCLPFLMPRGSLVSVISPLNSIMQGQLETSTSLKFQSRRIGKDDALDADILHGKVSMLFFGPELLQRQDFR